MTDPEVEYGIKNLKTGEIFFGFAAESEALVWLQEQKYLSPNDCITVHRHKVWTDWAEVHQL